MSKVLTVLSTCVAKFMSWMFFFDSSVGTLKKFWTLAKMWCSLPSHVNKNSGPFRDKTTHSDDAFVASVDDGDARTCGSPGFHGSRDRDRRMTPMTFRCVRGGGPLQSG